MLLFATLWACSSPPAEPPAPSPPTEAERQALKEHMQGHLRAVEAVRTALVQGDLHTAKKANREFLNHKVAFDLPGDWLTHVGAMGEAAVALDGATTLEEAAARAAEVAAACGGCHTAVGAEVVLPLGPEGEEHAVAESRALQERWRGLIVGATEPGAADGAASALVACATCHAKAPENVPD